MKRAGRLLRHPAHRTKRRISRDRSCPSFSTSVDEDGVSRYALDNFTCILYHTHRAKVAEKGKENGDDTHPQARENMVVLV